MNYRFFFVTSTYYTYPITRREYEWTLFVVCIQYQVCMYSIIIYTIYSIKVYTYIMFIHIMGGGMHWVMFVGALRFYSYFHIQNNCIHIFLLSSYLEVSDPNIIFRKTTSTCCPAVRAGNFLRTKTEKLHPCVVLRRERVQIVHNEA